MRKTTEGKCYYCKKVFNKTAIKKHLDSCDERKRLIEKTEKKNANGERCFCVSVEGFYIPAYWLYLDISSLATFRDLDEFLRDIWLECCGHLSAFEIKGIRYSSSPDRLYGEKHMSVDLTKILNVGIQFTYDYDFGTTTRLKLKVISECQRIKSDKKIELMARNLPPEIKCSYREENAKQVCVECKSWLCNKCVETHECDENMLLPVVNSPRVGQCGYTGSEED